MLDIESLPQRVKKLKIILAPKISWEKIEFEDRLLPSLKRRKP